MSLVARWCSTALARSRSSRATRGSGSAGPGCLGPTGSMSLPRVDDRLVIEPTPGRQGRLKSVERSGSGERTLARALVAELVALGEAVRSADLRLALAPRLLGGLGPQRRHLGDRP